MNSVTSVTKRQNQKNDTIHADFLFFVFCFFEAFVAILYFSLIGHFWTLLIGHFGLFSISSQIEATLYFTR